MPRSVLILVLVIVVAAGAAAWYWRGDALAPWFSGDEDAAGGRTAQATPVEIAPVRRADIEVTASAVGTLEAREQVALTTDAEGIVRTIHFTEGEPVAEGELLVELDSAEEEAVLSAAQARRARIAQDLERARALLESEFATEARVDELEAELAQAEADIEVAEAELAERRIRAPFAGMVGLRQVSPGALIEVGTPIATLSRIDPIDLRFDLPAELAPELRPGLKVRASGDGLPDGPIEGEITVVEPRIDPATRSVTAEAAFANPDRGLRPGLFVQAEVVLDIREDALVVPEQALLRRGDDAYLFVVGPDKTVSRRAVRIGARRPGRVEVLDGVAGDERIVVAGLQQLRDGQKVRPVQRAAAREGAAGQGQDGSNE